MFILNPSRFASSGGGSNGLLTGLVSYWKLDEASGTRVDSHGSKDLTVLGTVSSATGVISNALSLSGAGAAIRANDVVSGSGDMSISLWFNSPTSSANSAINAILVLGNVSIAGSQFYWCIESGGTLWGRFHGGNTRSYGTGLDDSNWHHLLIVKPSGVSSAGINLFVDGASVTGSFTGTTTLNVGTDDFRVGGDSIRYFTGSVDECAAWNVALGATDAANLYNSGNGLPYSSFTT